VGWFQLNSAKVCYPVSRLEGLDGQASAAGADQTGTAVTAHQAQGSISLCARSSTVSGDQRGPAGSQHLRSGGPGGLPFHGGVRLGSTLQPKRVRDLRAGLEPEGAPSHTEGRATPGVGGGRPFQPRRTGTPIFELVGAETHRVLPWATLVAAGQR